MLKINYDNIIEDKKRGFLAKGASFDINKWDGSDVFKVGGWKIITKKVYELFKKHKITAIEMTRLTDYTSWLGYTMEQALKNSIREKERQDKRWEEFKASI